MKHEKTFAAIAKLKDIEVELHRLKNALEIANKALDARREWVGLTDEEIETIYANCSAWDKFEYERMLEAKLKEKNT
jgi:hypothetical protein